MQNKGQPASHFPGHLSRSRRKMLPQILRLVYIRFLRNQKQYPSQEDSQGQCRRKAKPVLLPDVLLPATTALGTVLGDGRQQGMLHGCNVVMPNLSPEDVREKYALYDNKLSFGAEAAESVQLLKASMAAIGHQVVTDRGDWKGEGA